MRFVRNCSAKNLCTYNVGGNIECVFFPKDINEIKTAKCMLKKLKYTQKVVGLGSKLLFSDKLSNTFGVVCMRDFEGIELLKEGKVYVKSGTKLSALCLFLQQNSLSGFEWACGIPASVGGAIVNNAGCFGKSMQAFVLFVDCLNEKNEFVRIENKDCCFGYRSSIFKNKKFVIVGVQFSFKSGNSDEIFCLMQDYARKRAEKQPIGFSCGSVFKNPANDFAGRLIEACGIKGLCLGGAKISEKHANFIINNKNAKFEDVVNLIEIAKCLVYNKFNIHLELELEIVE